MQSSSFHFLPPLFPLLAIVLAVVVAVLQIGVLGYAYEKMGVSRFAAYAILLASLLGSSINIPIAEIPEGQRSVGTQVVVDQWLGTRYTVPVVERWPSSMIALNVGGALVPTLLSFYLIGKNHIYGQALLGTAAVAAVVHALAYPVPQMGIAVPVLIPPVVSALVAMFLSRDYAAPLAYASGCLGTLLGADLMNLGELSRLGASIASIGGAGTFDGVFLTGVLAVLLAGKPRLPHHDVGSPDAAAAAGAQAGTADGLR
jgi:uncharacterized membrane protein